MDGDDDLNATQAAAIVALLLVLVVPVAVAAAAWCKRRYARAVVVLQAAAGAAAIEPPAPPAAPAPAAPGRLAIDLLDAGAAPATDAATPARRLRWRVLGAQFVAGLVYWWSLFIAALVAASHFVDVSTTPGPADAAAAEPSGLAALIVVCTLLLAAPVLATVLQAAWRERQVWAGTAVAAGLVAAGTATAGDPLPGIAFAGTLAAFALLLAAFLRPGVRGAGPPLVVALNAGLLVFWVPLMIAFASDPASADTPTSAGEIAAAALLLVVAVLVGRWMLIRLARRYQAKRFSELQLAAGAFWGQLTVLVVGAVLFLSFESKTGSAMEYVVVAILLVWFVWRIAQRLLLRLATLGAASALPPLLLLRVFKPSGRSEAFIDRFLARWRFAAPTWMIAGPDLAGAYMEPDEFFAWMRGRLGERFVRDAGDVDARVAAIDGARDPDGRFRVTELFCANATWQAAVLAMIARAGVVLLDLREYTDKRAGTHFELRELLRRADLDRVLLLTDEPGDAPRLRAALGSLWAEVGRPGAHRLRVLRVGAGTDAEMDGLVRAAAEAARRAPLPAPGGGAPAPRGA